MKTKTFEKYILFQLKYKIKSKKDKLPFLKYCLLNEEEKQYNWKTRNIKKEHSKNVKLLKTLITKLQYL